MATPQTRPGLRPKTPNDRIGHSNPTLEKMGYIPTMPYARIIPVVVAGLLFPLYCQGQESGPASTSPTAIAPPPAPVVRTMADNALDAAIVKVHLMTQIAASVEQKVDMLNQKFQIEGNYFKDFTKGLKVRLQLKLVGLGESGSTMLQVCDGKTLWDFQKVLKMQIYRKKEILPIMKELDESSLDEFYKSLVISNLGFGGPESLMNGLKKAVKFDQFSEEKLDGRDVYVVGGTWIDRSKLLGANDRGLPATSPLPPYVPTTVQLYVGKENGWPYKLVMTGITPVKVVEEARAYDPVSGRPIGVKKAPPKVDPTKITLLYNLLPLTEIKPGLFEFEPPADVAVSNVKDETDDFLKQLRLLIQSENNRKKAEAAKTAAGDEPLPKTKPLEIGSPQPDTGKFDTFPTPEKKSPK